MASTTNCRTACLAALQGRPGCGPYTYSMPAEVRKRRRGYTRVTSKYQATIPQSAAEAAGIQPGDELRVEAAGDGRVVLTREVDPVDALAALGERLGIHYPPGYLEDLRAEWE